MTAHHMGTLDRYQEKAVLRGAFAVMPADGLWAGLGLVAAVVAPLVFGWGAASLPAVLFLILCPFIVAGIVIADAAPSHDERSRIEDTAD